MMMKHTAHTRAPRILAVTAALAAGLLLGAPARAQHDPHKAPHGREHSAQDMARHLDQVMAHATERLQLTADQATRIRRILAQTGEQMHAFHERARQSGQAHPHPGGEPPAEMRALHERTMQQINEVLTESQRTRAREMFEEMHRRHGPGHHGGHGEHRPSPRP